MSHKYPLQIGDVAPDFSGRDSSSAADRREQSVATVQSEEGTNRAPEPGSPVAPLWKVGQVHPISAHSAPYDPVYMEGDTSGDGTTIHAIDIYSYGDCHDPHAPTRVRETGSEWKVDTDFDGAVN
jgi:hypothetical protein